ncbi:uncharacterized protein CANTADRAFT_8305 [Suhomyces tanzawaensis NRRL Y-17324]|uniref:BSD domain-containing protein n=1 Tax=Suhomyces tanzawaensis NRRL Y-17324 TaxID=984487 RepID=A0A1E4SCG5_9ASCO|nr:uncharacterized protein CANTADRAFT_8305 [Suhomyces tanzawaensis NRRL Y-17324]ODV77158.1 hypothetical protein CANTADRAFT_8305 [Suhomyces tanzawaensis NRRL Y-17324]
MEFIDPQIEPEKEAVPDKASKDQTEETVQRLESEIDKAYSAVEHKFQDLWTNASTQATGLQEKIKLEEHKKQLLSQLSNARLNINTELIETIKSQANHALDSLDSTLEQVEKQAGQYVSLFTSFFSSIVSVAPKEQEKEEVLFSLNDSYGTSRYDTELFKLHTSPSYYVDEASDAAKAFDADTKTTEIAELLQKYPNTLTKLMNDLVPVKLPYNQFWYWYFVHDDKLKESENKRKELLDKKTASGAGDDEEFTWDDDEEEEETQEEAVDVAKEVKPKKDDDDDDDDDDWE